MIVLGPLTLTYLPDGDDEGVGAIRIETPDTEATTAFTVPREQWEAAERASKKR